MAKDNTSNLSSTFRIVMEGEEEATFQACQGLEAEVDVIFHAEGGRGTSPRAVRGAPKVSKLSFSKGSITGKSGKSALLDWLKDVMDYSKPLKRQMLKIELLNASKETMRSWTVKDAWPCRWSGPVLSLEASDVVVETVVFAHEGISW